MKFNHKKIIIISVTLLVLLQAGLLFLFMSTGKIDFGIIGNFLKPEKASLTHYSYFSSQDFYTQAYDQAKNQIKKSNMEVYGGILPHHLMVKDKIAAYLEGLKDNQYETVVLIGPDHYNKARTASITSEAVWDTPYGIIEPDLKAINKMLEKDIIGIEEDPFSGEHSVSGLVAFIKKSFSKAKIVTILIKYQTTAEQSAKIAQKIFSSVNPEKTLVLSSVDFSHFLPADAADFHDLKSRAVIENFDFGNIYNTEVDSPPSVYVLLKYLESTQAQKSELIFSTNSGTLVNRPDEPTTSHQFFYFGKGDPLKNFAINFLFFGDLMLDRNVKAQFDKNGFDYLLANLAGEEQKFFKGIDIISANLEGAVTDKGDHYPPNNLYDFAFDPDDVAKLKNYGFNFFNLANNHFSDQGQRGIKETENNLAQLNINFSGCHDAQVGDCTSYIIEKGNMKIGMAGFSMVYNEFDLKEAEAIILDLKKRTDLVIINIHWGSEYTHQFGKTQQNVGRALIDAGADIIIGHHPHVVQGMEIYQNKPIFYSLGNFIFDQYFSADTQEELAVGINLNQGKFDYFLFPMKSDKSQPSLLNGSDKEKFIEKFAKWSQLDSRIIEKVKDGNFSL